MAKSAADTEYAAAIRHAIPPGDSKTAATAYGDITGDGIADVVIAEPKRARVWVFAGGKDGRYATAKVMTLVGDELTRFEALILRPDPELQRWLMDASQMPAPEVADQIAAIRAFHNSQTTKSAT